MEVYVDDILIKSKMRKEHLEALAKILQQSYEHNLKMNTKKCVFGVSLEKLLGFIVSKREIEIDPNKAKVIVEMPLSKKHQKAKRFNWMTLIYKKIYISTFSKMSSLL